MVCLFLLYVLLLVVPHKYHLISLIATRIYQILSDMFHWIESVMQHTAALSGVRPLSTCIGTAFHCSKSSALHLILPYCTSRKGIVPSAFGISCPRPLVRFHLFGKYRNGCVRGTAHKKTVFIYSLIVGLLENLF